MRISINIEAPTQIKPENKHVDLSEKICQYIDDINSNFTDSRHQWHYLKQVYKILTKKKLLSIEEKEILKLVAPEIEKHGTGAELDSATMNKHLE